MDYNYKYNLMLLNPKSIFLEPFNLLILINLAILGVTTVAIEVELLVG
jgi:hypothetical protein